MFAFFHKIVATCFFFGYFPLFPGTVGSILGLLAYFLMETYKVNFNPILNITLFFVFILGFFSSTQYSKMYLKHDPKEVIIDEFISQIFTLQFVNIVFYAFYQKNLLSINTLNLHHFKFCNYIFSFIFFRIFDIFKPWPICWIEKKFSYGAGIMLDDFFACIIASIFSFISCYLVLLVLG